MRALYSADPTQETCPVDHSGYTALTRQHELARPYRSAIYLHRLADLYHGSRNRLLCLSELPGSCFQRFAVRRADLRLFAAWLVGREYIRPKDIRVLAEILVGLGFW